MLLAIHNPANASARKKMSILFGADNLQREAMRGQTGERLPGRSSELVVCAAFKRSGQLLAKLRIDASKVPFQHYPQRCEAKKCACRALQSPFEGWPHRQFGPG